jgi:radical SAM superfamily enzyme YgiQ (UPF0313 family)
LKALLINPPRFQEIVGNNPLIIEEERGHNPPLGLLYLAASIEAAGRHAVSVLDAQVEELQYPELEARVREEAPDVVGITTMTLTLLDVIETVRAVKRVDGDIQVVLGGPHAHLYPTETIHLPGVDYVVLGEGERSFPELLGRLGDRRGLKDVKGLVFRDGDGKVVNTGMRDFLEDLDDIPFPARHLVPYRKYSSLMARRTPITTMITSRGCPYQCTFCDRPHLGKRFRARTALNVVDEMEECTRMGIHEFLIYDDTFTIDRERVLAICEEITRRRLDIGWDIRARVNTIDEELLGRLKGANCERIHFGVEAGTDSVLRTLLKGMTVGQAHEVFRATRRAGISTLGYFMLGSPGETLKEIEETMRVMKSLDPDFVHVTILTPFPGTKLYADALRRGIIKEDVWRAFARAPHGDFIPPHWDEHFSREELGDLLVKAYKGFYTRPRYILKGLGRVSSVGELKRKVRAGLKVMAMR